MATGAGVATGAGGVVVLVAASAGAGVAADVDPAGGSELNSTGACTLMYTLIY